MGLATFWTDLLGIKAEDMGEGIRITYARIDDETMVRMAEAFGKGLAGERLSNQERRYVKQIEANPQMRKMIEAKYLEIGDG